MTESTADNTLGAYLRHEREKRNISIEQLAYATRIGIKMLRSLEEDRHDELPAQPFVRGYLQAYGKYVGMDIQDLFLRYQHHLATHPETKKATLHSHYIYVKERYQERKQLFFVLSLFITLVFCAGAYFMLKTKREHGRMQTKAITLKEGPVSPPPTLPANTNANAALAAPQIHQAQPMPVKTPTPPSPAPTTVATSTSNTESNEPVQDATPKKYNLLLKSNADVWIRFQTDSDVIKDLTLRTGRTFTLHANKVIKLFSGNLGALQASLNGQQIETLLQPGRAMSAVLPESEIQNYPPPLFPSSPSPDNASSQSADSDADGNSEPTPDQH